MFVKRFLSIILLAFIALLAAPAVESGTVRGVSDTFEHQRNASSQTKLHHHRVLQEELTTEPAVEDEVAVEPRIISEIVSLFAAVLTLPLSLIQAVLGVF